MTQTVGDLIDALEEFDRDLPVALACQPNHPFEHHVGNVVSASVIPASSGGLDEVETVFIGEGGQRGYLAREVAEALGW